MYPCGLETAPSRSHSLPRCCSSLLSSEQGRGTCTYLHPGTGTYTRLLRRAKCYKTKTNGNVLLLIVPTIWKQFKLQFWDHPYPPFHKVDHVYNTRRADHGLVCQDGPHGLCHTELWSQWREKRLDLFPDQPRRKKKKKANMMIKSRLCLIKSAQSA